jgi:hypothetical protein
MRRRKRSCRVCKACSDPVDERSGAIWMSR